MGERSLKSPNQGMINMLGDENARYFNIIIPHSLYVLNYFIVYHR